MKTKFTLLLCVLTTSICFGKIEVEELNKFENKIVEIETKFDQEQSNLISEIETLNNQLSSLNSSQLTLRVEALEQKQENIEKLQVSQQNKEIEIYKTKYSVGVLIIKDIIQSIEKLKSQYDAVSFNDSYKDLSNPNNYSQYSDNLDFLQKKLVKKGLTLPKLDIPNPFLSTVYGIAQGLVSKQDNKDDKINDINCILNFTSRASQELNIVKYDLIYLQQSIDKMISDYNEIFKSYTSLVEYDKSFVDYIRNADDDLDKKIKTLFTKINSSSTELKEKEKAINSTKFQLKKIMDAYLKYEMFIAQNTAYYEKFDLIISSISPTCGNPTVNQEIKTKYDTVKDKLDTAKESFTKAFSGTIKQSYLKKLIQ